MSGPWTKAWFGTRRKDMWMKRMIGKQRIGHGRRSHGVWLVAMTIAITGAAANAQKQDATPADAAGTQARRAPNQQPRPAAQKRRPAAEPQAQPASNVDKLLDGLDTKLNLSGADLDAEVVGDQLILRGNEQDIQLVEALIHVLEQTTEQKELRVVTVSEKDARDIASSVGPAVADMLRQPNQRPEDDVVVTALSSTILLVSALPRDIDFVVSTIESVDAVKDELPPLEQLVFPIKNRRAKDVAQQLTDIIAKMQIRKGDSGGKSEIQVIANDANNSIMVLAPESERDKIQRLLDELDVEPAKGFGEIKLTLFPLFHSKAGEMSKVITDLLASPKDRDAAEEMIHRLSISKALPSGEIVDLPPIDLQRTIRIIADEGTNSLIVATAEENILPMRDLISLMDGVPMADNVSLKLFPLRFADAETVKSLLNEMFDKGGELTQDPDGAGTDAVPAGDLGKALVYNVGLFADVRTNTLVVTGREEHLSLVEQLVADLDQPARSLKFPLRFIQLSHTDASSIAKIITDLSDQRFEALQATGATGAALERERVFLSVDLRSNSLILSVSEENFEEILTIARQLDTAPAKLFDHIRIVKCDRLAASDLKDKIDELWKRKADLRREEELLEDLPVVVVDERSNSLIIASSVEDYEDIVELVTTLEKQPIIDDMELFQLKFADAVVLASMLDELFQGMAGGSESFTAPTVLPDPRSNSLVVAGTRDGIERTAQLVTRLDVETGPMTAIFKVYPLEHASAGQLSERIQELFDSRAEGQDIQRTPIVVLPDEASNSLVCSASRDDHEAIVGLLDLLDKPSSLARQFEIFPLKMAAAADVAEKLEGIFTSKAQGSSGRTDAIATQADERTNSVIVWASPAQMVNITEMIGRFDTAVPTKEMMVRVVQLKQALAEDFADLLKRTLLGEGSDAEKAVILSWLDKQPDGSEKLRKLLRQDIRFEADPRTNSLMLMAPSDSMAMLEAMIRDFDMIRPIRSELRLYPLVNADAETMVQKLEDIFKPTSGGGGDAATSQLVFGDTINDFDVASVGQELRFAADTRTNTLIAAGAEIDLRMVEELVRYLDSQAAEDRVTQVYRTKFLDASKLQTAVKDFFDQEEQVLSDMSDEEARSRAAERQVSIASIGDAEQGSSQLLIGTHQRMNDRTMRLIEELDRPEPQVMISVLIAEVKLTDSMELGIEIAGQELDFSRVAVLGPNGVIDGAEFDIIGGTNIGAEGSGLGFNFTITGEDMSFLLHALQQNSRLEVLSRPVLLVRNGDEGNITIADQVPFVSGSQLSDTGSVNSQVSREDVGIVLTATPNISPDGYVTIELQQEISSFSGENLQLTEGVSSPIFSTRELKTNVTVRDGETVVIGGLITSRHSEGVNKVPLLGDLPWVGPLFRTTNTSEQKTELLIVMTVDVLRTDSDVYDMSVEQRDKFVLPDSIRQSPLMEGLRIMPDASLMGPRDDLRQKAPAPSPADVRPQTEDRFGPRPRTYGPVVPRPKPTTTTQIPTYGPQIVRQKVALDG